MSIYGSKPTRRPPVRRAAHAVEYQDSSFIIRRRKRFWEIIDRRGELVCITVYKRGAIEVVRRLALAPEAIPTAGS